MCMYRLSSQSVTDQVSLDMIIVLHSKPLKALSTLRFRKIRTKHFTYCSSLCGSH